MVRAVASRVALRPRVSKAVAKETANHEAMMKHLAIKADAPLSVTRVPVGASATFESAGAMIRNMGTSRRVFLLSPHLAAEEIEGLAFRLKSMSKSESINSILIATDDKDDAENNCLPRYLDSTPNYGGVSLDFEPKNNHSWHVSGGYDPLKIADIVLDASFDDQSQYLVDSLKKLALATKGDQMETRVPVITFPHGAVTDGGYALCMGGYVLATRQTSFRIMNPSRGLSLDPIGLSYILPRLGSEYKQMSAKYRGCGMILALSGYEADCFDMVETGLATHIVESSESLPVMEHALATTAPWDQQKLVKKPNHFYGQRRPLDANAKFRNVTVANLIEQLSDHSANEKNSLSLDYALGNVEDPALDTDQVPWDEGFFSTELVDIAAHFDKIFRQEKSVEGIIERLKEAGSKESDESEVQMGIDAANDLVARMEKQSPLALRVTHQLMKMGSAEHATLEMSMDREAKALQKLFTKKDFSGWAEHVRKHGGEMLAPEFTAWQHKNVAAVTAEEVDEILS
jgi:enoyl-CoA hydratase/carnithine racemase